jgi:16S rRNA (cytosine967-C5)-methyltransferase
VTPGARIQAAIEVLEQVHAAWAAKRVLPVDALFADYYRARRYIGSKDRQAISELVYFALRNGAALEWHVEQCNKAVNPRRIVMLAVWFSQQADIDHLRKCFSGGPYCPAPLTESDVGILQRIDESPLIMEAMPVPVRLNFPDWLEPMLRARFGDELDAALLALNTQASIDLRTNTIKCRDRGDLILALDADGYFAGPTPSSPLGVRLKKRLPAFNTAAFKAGMYEMQDEASQIVSLLVDAKPGQKVIDFCAGAGGKTLAIAATMQNKGRILAFDISKDRLSQITKRLARAGVSNVVTRVIRDEQDPFIKRHKATADWVLVDAPCSGSGTWRRNPDLKWRFSREDLREVIEVQQRILQSAARLVLPKGKLVYATCSLLAQENEEQVKRFLETHPSFRVAHPGEIWNKHIRSVPELGPVLSTSPHQDGMDGFFAAVLEHTG